MWKKYRFLLSPVIATALCSLLFFTPLDNSMYDLFLRTIPTLTEDNRILLVNVDDDSIEFAGIFPWTRDLYADAVVFLREMGAEAVVFDLSFLDPSTARVDPAYIHDQLPRYLNEGFAAINENAGSIIDGFASGALNAQDAEEAKEAVHSVNREIQNSLAVNIAYAARDVDAYFADALKLFGNSYLTITMVTRDDLLEEDSSFYIDPEILSWLEENIALKNITGKNDKKTPELIGIWPAIHKLMVKAGGAGFVNAQVDTDGYRRRVYLFLKYNGKYYSHLMLTAMGAMLGNPDIEISNSAVVLKNARVKNAVKDIRIPRAEDGSILLKWPKKPFKEYNTMSITNLIRYPQIEQRLAGNLSLMANSYFFAYWDEDDTPLEKYEQANYIKEILYQGEDNGEGVTFQTYLEYRGEYLKAVNKFLSAGFEEAILNDAAGDGELVSYVTELFDVTREQYNTLVSIREEISGRTAGRTCVVGVDATSMTDLGLTTFQERYPNVGTYAVLANQILSGEFLDDTPFLISALIALALAVAIAFIIRQLETSKSILAGLIAMAATAAVFVVFFILTKRYLGLAVPLAAVTLTFLSLTGINFFSTIREKSFLRSAFSRYLAPSVIEQIIADPSKLNLGGESREMTAIFTDIQRFSTISEALQKEHREKGAEALVNLLNLYLTEMSDIVLANQGTIDKFEGDAIIAFFGAPIPTEKHAALACRAAVQMKQAEITLKERIMDSSGPFYKPLSGLIEKGLIPSQRPLYTRLGINTGVMVVGNMGTPNKMDYTIMGNAVNLAARLEGVNKQYHTNGILISEYTRDKIGGEFIVRALSRVRVVGITTPLRIYELLGLREEAPQAVAAMIGIWEEAVAFYEAKEFRKAEKLFKDIHEADNSDATAEYYMDRCAQYTGSPPAADWDGVDNLTQK
jgi:adenylate cyclase